MKLELPCNIALCGSTMSGKTYRTKKILNSILPELDYVFVFSPTSKISDDWTSYKDNKKFTITDTNFESSIKELFSQQHSNLKTLHKRDIPNALIIIDDCVNERILDFKGLVDKYSTKARHYYISLMVLSQRISGIPRTFRLNCKYVFLFSPSNLTELERFLKEYVLTKDHKSLTLKIPEIYKEKYSYIRVHCFESNVNERLFQCNAKGEELKMELK